MKLIKEMSKSLLLTLRSVVKEDERRVLIKTAFTISRLCPSDSITYHKPGKN